MNVKTSYEKAVEARAAVARLQCLVDAAHVAWETAFREAAPDTHLSTDPEVEWDDPKSEEEALRDLRVARLGGELVAACHALDGAKVHARCVTKMAMCEAALEGRRAWTERHGNP